MVTSRTAALPGCDAVTENALNAATIKVCEDVWDHSKPSQIPLEVHMLAPFLNEKEPWKLSTVYRTTIKLYFISPLLSESLR